MRVQWTEGLRIAWRQWKTRDTVENPSVELAQREDLLVTKIVYNRRFWVSAIKLEKNRYYT